MSTLNQNQQQNQTVTSQSKIQKIATALTAVTSNCYHYHAPAKVKAPYIVWQENGEVASLQANDKKVEQALYGYADYFTKTEYDATIDSIQEALNGIVGCSWELASVLYGDPTREDDNLIHYTWEWELM